VYGDIRRSNSLIFNLSFSFNFLVRKNSIGRGGENLEKHKKWESKRDNRRTISFPKSQFLDEEPQKHPKKQNPESQKPVKIILLYLNF
jgi:hypothetical protein